MHGLITTLRMARLFFRTLDYAAEHGIEPFAWLRFLLLAKPASVDVGVRVIKA